MDRRQTALITGASSGIGLDLAHLFARDGWDVILVARTESKLREIAKTVETAHKVRAFVVPADLTQRDAPQLIFDEVARQALPVDSLVNNAGFGLAGAFVETDLARELEMIQVNIAAVTHLTKLFLPQMVQRRSGRIMNVASTAAFQPGPLMAVYYATKAYVLSWSEALSEELAGSGVTVTALCPGATATGFADVAAMSKSRLFNLTKPMTSMDVAREGYKAMMAGKRVVVTGMRNKVMAQSIRVSPRSLVTKIVKRLQEDA